MKKCVRRTDSSRPWCYYITINTDKVFVNPPWTWVSTELTDWLEEHGIYEYSVLKILPDNAWKIGVDTNEKTALLLILKWGA